MMAGRIPRPTAPGQGMGAFSDLARAERQKFLYRQPEAYAGVSAAPRPDGPSQLPPLPIGPRRPY